MPTATNLTLSRKVGEEIVLIQPDGSRQVVFVSEIRGDKVRLSVRALPEVKVFRRELLDEMEKHITSEDQLIPHVSRKLQPGNPCRPWEAVK